MSASGDLSCKGIVLYITLTNIEEKTKVCGPLLIKNQKVHGLISSLLMAKKDHCDRYAETTLSMIVCAFCFSSSSKNVPLLPN